MPPTVKAAILSFTEIADGQHREFNEWHRYDHMPEQFVVEGVVAGERFVATPDLLTKRFAIDESLDTTHYFGFYFMSQDLAKTFAEQEKLGAKLRGRGRTFNRSGPSAGYRLLHTYSSPEVVSAPEVMPYRPHQGVYVTVDDTNPDVSSDDLAAHFSEHEGTTVPCVLAVPGVAGCWTFEASHSMVVPGSPLPPSGRVIRIYWLDGDPGAVVDALGANAPPTSSGTSDSYSTVFQGAFRFIRPDSAFDWFDAT